MKKRKCSQCLRNFQQQRPLQYLCGWECATAYAKKKEEEKKEKAWKDSKKKLKEDLKTKKDYEKELEIIVNRYIRKRDALLPCVSCNAQPGTYKLTAGHYYPAGSYKNLRFLEDNIHGQCWWNCNKNKHGNLIEYRKEIIRRIGEDRLEELDRLSRIPRHYTIPELIELKEIYKEKIRKL